MIEHLMANDPTLNSIQQAFKMGFLQINNELAKKYSFLAKLNFST